MTIQIVVLNTSGPGDGTFEVSGVFWLVPSGNYVPQPNLKSQVPFIDQADLAALQVGTVIEQPFTTGLYAAGTTWSSVQSDLQSQYSTAQTNLSDLASPLTNVVGNIYDTVAGWETTNPFTPFSSLIAIGSLNAANATVQVSMYQYNSVGVQFAAGTLSGVIVAETSFDNGVTWNQTFFAQVGSGNKNSVLGFSNPNPAQAYSLVMNGGVGLARVRVYSYTSGSCAVTLRASNIFDESLDLDLASPGTALPPSVSAVGGSVTTTAPTYATGSTNFISLNTSGSVRVDGSGVTQPVSGTVAVTESGTWTVQPGNTPNTTPWLATISQGGNSASVTAKGTQGSEALTVQEIKDSGRVSFVANATVVAGVTTEGLVTLTPIRANVAGSTGTSLTVTSGKTLRLQSLVLSVRNSTTTQTSAIIRVRMNPTTTVTATGQVYFTVAACCLNALTGGTGSAVLDLPDGFEISGTTQFGITQLSSATSANLDIALIGFEY